MTGREYTVAEITDYAKRLFQYRGVKLHRISNQVWGKRRGTVTKGFPDLTGHNKQGLAVYVEVKTLRDKIREEQIVFFMEAVECGCLCFVATQRKPGGEIEVVSFQEYLNGGK